MRVQPAQARITFPTWEPVRPVGVWRHAPTFELKTPKGDQDAATAALRAAQPELMRGVTKGVFHKNTASRKMSRLAARVKAIG